MCVMLCSVHVYTFFFSDPTFMSGSGRWWYLSVVCALWLSGLLLLRLRSFFIAAGAAVMPFVPVEASSLYLNGQPVSMPFMHWIISTNRHEAAELLSSMWWMVVLTAVLWGVYVWLLTGVENKRVPEGKGRRWGAVVLAAVCAGLLLMHGNRLNKTYTAPSKRVYAGIYAWSLGMHLADVFPLDVYVQTFRAMKHASEIEGLQQLDDFSFGVNRKTDTEEEVYLLIIGEAARYKNFSLNGEYGRETTPRLSKQHNLLSFQSAWAQANATDRSVPLMLTRADAEHPQKAYSEKTVGGAFQEAGFAVWWLTTKQSPIRYLHHVLPTFEHVWTCPKDKEDVLDEELISPLRAAIESKEERKKLIIMQMKGSHLNYQDRYPEPFAVFKPCLERGAKQGHFDKELMTNTYDNTIVYTDYVLSRFIGILDSARVAVCMVYMPDHGENLCDDERRLWVHGSYEGSEYEYHVPLLVWYSEKFAERHPEQVAAMKENRRKTVTSQVLFHSLCDMAGLEEVADKRKSLLSGQLESQEEVRVLNGKAEITTFRP